jgi:hypothetical protein
VVQGVPASADVDLEALIAAGRGDTTVPLLRLPLAAHRLRGHRAGRAEAVVTTPRPW